jgi:hypothetical protein
LEDPVSDTEEPCALNDPYGTEEVSQLPATLRVDEAKVIVAAPPEDVTFALKVTVALVRVRAAVHVMLEANVVVMPLLTVRLYRVCGMLLVPADTLTATVDVPTVKVAPPAEVSSDLTVIVLLPAVRVPVAVTVAVEPPLTSLFEVVSVPEMLNVAETSMALDCVIDPLTVRL